MGVRGHHLKNQGDQTKRSLKWRMERKEAKGGNMGKATAANLAYGEGSSCSTEGKAGGRPGGRVDVVGGESVGDGVGMKAAAWMDGHADRKKDEAVETTGSQRRRKKRSAKFLSNWWRMGVQGVRM